MIRLPSYVPVATGVWLVPAIISLIVSPMPLGIAWLAPSPYGATIALQYRTHLALGPGCAQAAAQYWQEVAASPHAATWFHALVHEGPTATSRAYGLVGLHSLDPALARRAVESLPPTLLNDTVQIAIGDTTNWTWSDSSMSLGTFAVPATLERHAEALAGDQRGCPES